ncbi:hypothetical protein D6827_02395, partial [Candidatus Parcubacteria bacterium]
MPDFLKDTNELKERKNLGSGNSDIKSAPNSAVVEKMNAANFESIAGILLEGRFWYWRTPINTVSIVLRKIRQKTQRAINTLATLIAIVGVVVAAIIIGFNVAEGGLPVDYWNQENPVYLFLS